MVKQYPKSDINVIDEQNKLLLLSLLLVYDYIIKHIEVEMASMFLINIKSWHSNDDLNYSIYIYVRNVPRKRKENIITG